MATLQEAKKVLLEQATLLVKSGDVPSSTSKPILGEKCSAFAAHLRRNTTTPFTIIQMEIMIFVFEGNTAIRV